MEAKRPGCGRARLFLLFSALVLSGTIAYSNTFNAPFVFDDWDYIRRNPLIDSPSHLLNPTLAAEHPMPGNVRICIITRYAGHLSFFLNHALNGLDVRGYHALNLAVHLANGMLLYLLVSSLFGTPFLSGSALVRSSGGIAAASAAIFLLHPVQTQAVTYITQRFTSLATLFFMASALLYIRHRQSGGAPLYVLSLLSASAAMFTKEISFTLPLVVASAEFMFFTGPAGRRLARLAPFALTMLIVPFCIIDWRTGGIEALEEATRTDAVTPRLAYMATGLRAAATYMRLIFLPVNQNLDYDYPLQGSLLAPPVLVSSLLVLSVSCAALYMAGPGARRDASWRLASFGILWFFVTLSVESSAIVLADLINEHRLYLPSAGLFPTLAVCSALAFRACGRRGGRMAPVFPIALLLVLLPATYSRNGVWTTEERLWEDVVAKSPNKARGHNNLATAYKNDGRLEEASAHYRASISLEPDYAVAHFNLGNLYSELGMVGPAMMHYNLAIRYRPDYSNAYNNLGLIYYRNGDIQGAVENYLAAISCDHQNELAHYNLALAYDAAGRDDEALRHYLAAISIRPDYIKAHFNLGVMHLEAGRLDKAREELSRVLALDPDFEPAVGYVRDLGGKTR